MQGRFLFVILSLVLSIAAMPVPSLTNILAGDAIRTILLPRQPMNSVTIETLSSEKREYRDYSDGNGDKKRDYRDGGKRTLVDEDNQGWSKRDEYSGDNRNGGKRDEYSGDNRNGG